MESQTLHAENYFYSSESADYQPFLVLNYDSSPVPAPGTILLLCAGLLGLSGLNRRKMKE
ncbi:MAG: PEP-CTERM sorting domain-containing protein [Proteobacteria bacterium]|nr:PEP-CTERM sorting domain-containing protein [Pseudomonadota bacterium]MBU1389041.1 PEP-CTERM sorting domain-containing protein [Pseudomonadota bacterium]MBU1543593.1 PEP-CTERM sorting domain-containing protein [Pseudomonadota bacterium]MBU2431570.1 PEP-CTERM sorting domain-containing protein [Pseudomonadota bacterium]MBU2481944.1 PEP-CTERM sorting domain-containing protein [Pseudomonadota bacterium]